MDILSVTALNRKSKAELYLLLRKYFLFFSFLLPYGALAPTVAQAAGLERQVKAAYLYKFASYVEWPDGAFPRQDSPLVIGIIGADDMADELENMIAGHTVNGRTIVARKLKSGDHLAGLHILFIGDLNKPHLAELFSAVKNKPVLTVTESEETHALGSMINFVITDDRVRFEVNLAPVNASGLRISARMLAAAYKVTPRPA
jgi:hypothetical protein